MTTIEITTKFVKENKGKRFNITLSDGTTHNKIAFFDYYGSICYMNSRQKRRGYLLSHDWEIVKLKEVTPPAIDPIKNAKRLYNKTHKNAWDNLIQDWSDYINGGEMSNDFKNHFMDKLTFRSMTTLLSDYELELLKEAFDKKKEFTWNRLANSPRGRDLSIVTKMCDDGIFRAWFSSEFYRCGNGDYYLLLNPTTAVYYERD